MLMDVAKTLIVWDRLGGGEILENPDGRLQGAA
jgi:hypothetical protein